MDYSWPMPDMILFPAAHAAIGAAAASAVAGLSGVRGKQLGHYAILGALGGALPDIDHPLTGGRTFGHGMPSLVGGLIGIGVGVATKNKGITAFAVGWCTHFLVDGANIGI